MKNNITKIHFPLPILVGEGRLILDAATAHPDVGARLDANYLPDTAAALDLVKAQATDEKQKRGQAGASNRAQLDKIHAFQKNIHDARETAKLAFKGQDVKLCEQFQVGIHKPHDLQSQLQRGRTILAGLQAPENAPTLAGKGWTAADTAALDASIKAIETDKTLLESAKVAGVGLTGQKNALSED